VAIAEGKAAHRPSPDFSLTERTGRSGGFAMPV
jgi:hypothetical protein